MRLTRIPASVEGLAATAELRRRLASRPADHTQTVEQRRSAIAEAAAAASGIAVTHELLDGVPVERHGSTNDNCVRALLYAHGGAYVIGSATTHRGLAASLASAARCPLFSVDYRLAPEHPFPAGRDDVVAAYSALLRRGVGPVALVGDSAGGGLVLQAALGIQRRGLAKPHAIAVTSPWVDLACDGASYRDRAAAEAMLSLEGLVSDSLRYRGDRLADDPELSLVHADLSGLPPVLIQVGEHEILHDDAVLLAEHLSAAGVPVELEIWDGMIHAWHAFRGIVPEAEAAVARIAAFLCAYLVTGQPDVGSGQQSGVM